MATNSNGVDIVAANNVLKRVFGNRKAVVQFEAAAPYFKSRKKVPKGFGAGLWEGIQYSDIQSIGVRNSNGNDNQDMPLATAPAWDQPNWDAVRKYVRIPLSGKAQSRAFDNDNVQSFMGGVADLTASATRAYYKDQEFCVFNTSTPSGNKTGCRGILNNAAYTSGGGNTLNTFTLDTSTAQSRRYRALQGIFQGMYLDVYDKSTWTLAATIQVTLADELAGTFQGYINADLAGTSDNWYLFRNGDFNQDVIGLGDIIDDGTNTTTYGSLTTGGLWKSYVLANGGTLRDFSPTLMNQAQLRLEKRNDGVEKMEAWMSYGMKEQLLAFYQRTIISTKGMGTSPFSVNVGGDVDKWGPNFDIRTSPRFPSHEIHLILPKAIDILEQQPFGPVSIGGGTGTTPQFFMRLPGKDNWEALLRHDYQQRTLERNKFIKIADINQNSY